VDAEHRDSCLFRILAVLANANSTTESINGTQAHWNYLLQMSGKQAPQGGVLQKPTAAQPFKKFPAS
jgi:hypothetical protein